MKQYSIVIYSSKGGAIPDPLILLGEGSNIATVFTDDIDSVRKLIEDDGHEVRQINAIESEGISLKDSLLLGETEDTLSGFG